MSEKCYKVEWSPELLSYLAEKGYDPVYGARPLKRVIQREIENLLANKIIGGEVKSGGVVKAGVDGEGVVVK